jgi:hypothetical protein
MLKSILVLTAVASLYGCSNPSLTAMRGPWCAQPQPCGFTKTETLASADTGAGSDQASPAMYGHGRDGGYGAARSAR